MVSETDGQGSRGGPAPIALFAYKRPDHLRVTIEALAANDLAKASRLTIFCDGARSEAEQEAVDAVRSYAHAVDGFAEVTVVASERNLGLAASIISGVTRMLAAHDRVIVVEDDLVTSPHFLRYMNEALGLYADEDRVASVHGYIYPVRDALPDTFFLRGADCWGWATWARAWRHFEPDASVLLERLRREGLEHAFDLDGAMGFTAMLRDYAEGRNNSWAVRWHASAFLADMLTLYPGLSLVDNIGCDGSGTHCVDAADTYAVTVAARAAAVEKLPIAENQAARQAVIRFFQAPDAPRA